VDDTFLNRMADALDRLAPPPVARPRDDAAAYHWDGRALVAVALAATPLALLTGIDAQKGAFTENLARHAAGAAAHDALLWGARGMGKSALVKAAVAAEPRVALVELATGDLTTLPALFAALALWSRPVLMFIDDLGFDDDIAAARAFRSVLDGGSSARPAHVRLAVTSNRRHVVARAMEEQASAINPRDVIDDRLALADRFGLSLGFHNCDQDTYLAMVAAYAASLALPFDAQDAIGFAVQRGNRSGRVAHHYAVELAGRAGRALI
jgi:uncharacterized protein